MVPAELGDVSSAVRVLSSMITPAILILASGSILATTSSRLIRVVDRVRELSADIRAAASDPGDDELSRGTRELQFVMLKSATRRARLLQRAMTQLYLAVGSFILTSLVIGVLALSGVDVGWSALAFGFIGAMLLLSASALLIAESRMALTSTRAETDFVWKWGERHLNITLPEAPDKQG